MAKGKAVEADESVESLEAMKARIAELEDKVRAGEEGALKRVSAAMGVTPESVKAKEVAKPQPEQMVKMFVQTVVRINGTAYQGHITVPLSVARNIDSMIGNRRTRLINELTHSKYQLQEINGGAYAPRLVGREVKLESQ